ncbi:hypothetical protein K432DRAFT_388499 [Lepidopterella palustris CBS 459.81]|uniref:MARVEL domain-containing protein n=1 Tax=Lepidopterella palustris CBS 459.81 TaxID=1314670 RepID=A0A8E2JK45_9PEZI|nr:hypothetical protein K432DRAFT_388499 [Lepidopterella palustris CBS 459.81]
MFKNKTMKGVSASHDINIGSILRLIVRFLQFVLALTVAGLYGTDLHHAAQAHKYADSKWVYAVVVAGLSAISAVVFMLPLIKSWAFFAWDALMFILYMALFGTFGKLYINENPEGDAGIIRMKHAVWVDLVNMLLWFGTAVYGTVVFFLHRRRSTFTGRAEV